MDFHTAESLSRYQQSEEPFYHSPAHQPDDMVCEGSDSEQTEEEIWLKRLRYEDHAQRYMRGCLPTLQSARLRGPLENRSEWSNPWRYIPPERPVRLRNDCASGPSSVAQAVVEANIDRPDRTSSTRRYAKSAIVMSSRPEDTNSSAWLTDHGTTQRSQYVNRTLSQTDSYRQLVNNNAPASTDNGTPELLVEVTGNVTRGPKRASDTQWLKGSYVSKRGRWNEPAMTTPTPNPETLNQKLQRKHQVASRLGGMSSYPHSTNTNPFGSLPDVPKNIQPKESQEIAGLNHTIELESTVFRYRQSSNRPSLTTDGLDSLAANSPNQGQITQDDSRIESSFYPQKSSLENPTGKGSRTYSARQPSLHGNTPILSLKSHKTPASSAYYQDSQSAGSEPQTLPKLPRPSSSTGRKEESGSEDELSYVTEVAPSSRNLEEFQFRKKRVRNSNSVSAVSKPNGQRPRPIPRSLPISEPPQSGKINGSSPPKQTAEFLNLKIGTVENFRSDNQNFGGVKAESEANEGTGEQQEDVLASGPYRQWYEAQSTKSQHIVDSYPESEQLQSSSSKVVDVVRTPKSSPRYAIDSNPGAARSKHFSSNQEKSNVASAMQPNNASGSRNNDRTPPGRTKLPSIPQSSPSRLNSKQEKSTSLPISGLAKPVYIDGSSTQSFNSTPTRSAGVESVQRSSFHSSQADRRTDQEDPSPTANKLVDAEAQSKTQQTPSPEPLIECHLDSSPDCQHSVKSPGATFSSEKSSKQQLQSSWAQSHAGSSSAEEAASSKLKVKPISAGTPKSTTSEVQSQVVGPGEQSPWTVVDIAPLPKTISVATPPLESPVILANTQSSSLFTKISPEQETGWQPAKHPATPANDEIRLSNDPMAPPLVSGIAQNNEEEPGLSVQRLIEATTNPWATNQIKSAVKKTDKRVSFGILSDDPEEIEQDYHPRRLGSSPPPPQHSEFVEIEDALNDSTIVTGFRKHINICASKQTRRLLSEDSQSTGSPSIGAMAEAFIAADRDLLAQEESNGKLSESSRHFKPASPAGSNTVRRDSATFDFSFSRDLLDSSPPPAVGPVQTPGFDMDEAIGGFAEFLGDWSVESELQKVKNLNSAPTPTPARSAESNGTKRRRLFGVA